MALPGDLTSTRPVSGASSDESAYPFTEETGLFGQMMGTGGQLGANQTQLREGAQQFHGISPQQWDTLNERQKNQAITSYLTGIENPAGYKGQLIPIDPKLLPKEQAQGKKDAASSQSFAQQIANALANTPLDQYMLSLGQQANQLANLEIAGNNVIAGALGQAGAVSGSGAVAAALNNYANVSGQAAQVDARALANMGVANQEYVRSAPLQPFINLLTQGLGSGQYKQLPSGLGNQLPIALQFALSQAGVQGINTPRGGWPKALTQGSTNSNLGSILTQGTSNPYTTPGTGVSPNPNPNVPSAG